MYAKKINRSRAVKKYTYLGCPATKNRSPWCFRLCKPDAENRGNCGRIAPHSFKGHIQQGIIDYDNKKARNKLIKIVKRDRKIPEYTFLGCPMTKNRSPWCFRMCAPDKNGRGKCGRVAPHTLRGNIQQGILDFEKRKDEENALKK